MEYLNINPSSINHFFNTITREGKDQIFFEDVVQVIGYLEESKMKKSEENNNSTGLNLNLLEIKNILNNFDDLINVKSVNELEEALDGVYLMFVVDFESQHGKGRAPSLFSEINNTVFFNMLKQHPSQLQGSLLKKLEEKNLKQETGKIQVTLGSSSKSKNFIHFTK